MPENKVDIPFVSIKPLGKQIDVTWGYTTLTRSEEDGRVSCYIPSFDIYFSAKDEESSVKKGMILSRMFFDHYLIHDNSKHGLKRLVLQLHKLGFKATNDAYTIHKLSNNIIIPAKFKVSDKAIPYEFMEATSSAHQSKMAVAI